MNNIRLPRGCQSSVGEDDASYITSPMAHLRNQASFIKIKETSQNGKSDDEIMTPNNYKQFYTKKREECHSDIQHLRTGSMKHGLEQDRYSQQQKANDYEVGQLYNPN